VSVLLIDVGNTSTTIGYGLGRMISRVSHIPTVECTKSADVRKIVDIACRGDRPECAVLCSVVPATNGRWKSALRAARVSCLVVSHEIELGVRVAYPKPATIGADRLANATAACRDFGSPVIVADFGTALTFDVVDASGSYVGGVIAPGLPLMTDYLCERTALLPRVSLQGACAPIGRSTAGAMRIGARVGYRGMVREITDYLRSVAGMDGAALCATGGYADWALRGSNLGYCVDPDLTLKGLSRIHELNMAQ
jgi:type III pantothenate kinase